MPSFNHNVIKHKVGLLNLAEELGNVSKACKESMKGRGGAKCDLIKFIAGLLDAFYQSANRGESSRQPHVQIGVENRLRLVK